MRIGHFEIKAINTGMFKLDGGAMFGSVPKPMWEKAIPPDEMNRIPMALRLILLRDLKTGRNLIVDTGIGHKWSEKLQKIYAIDHAQETLASALSQEGLRFDQITDVVLTHLHFDHAGGATVRNEAGELAPAFPNAKYYIQKDNYDWATRPNSREAASYLPENFEPLMKAGKLIICNGVQDFESKIQWPGFSVVVSYGHTIGLQCPKITIEDKVFFYPSDLIPTSAHVPLPWVMGYDIHVIKILDEKEAVLKEAAASDWVFVYEHDPKIAASTIRMGSKHFEVNQALSSSLTA